MEARLKTIWRKARRHLALLRVRVKQIRGIAHILRPHLDRQLLAAAGVILVLGICSVAAALPASHLLTDQNSTTRTTHPGAHTPTPQAHAGIIKPHATATVQPQKAEPTAVAHTKPTAVPTSISTEAQTPLHLTEPNISDPTAATGAPWWQSLLDVTWKLALVVGLIYLVMRALAALKQRGFSPKRPLGNKGHKQQRHFFEQIEEMQLAPQHVLHAVRAGDRIFLIARTQGALRALGEVELSEVTGEEATTGASSSFADQMFRAWSGLANKQNESAPAHAAKAATSSTSIPMPNMHPKKTEEATPAFLTDGEEDVIDAKWVTVKPNVTPIMSLARITPETVAANTPLPLRRGTARDSELPPPPSEPLSESLEREILWYAEEHNDSAAAKKYGMTRQRVTAMRMRMERERLGRLLEEHRRERDVKLSQRPPVAAASMGKREERPISKAPLPTAPDHPRGNFAEAERTPVPIARGSAARTAYTQNTGSTPPAPSAKSVVKPDVAPTTNGPKSDAEEQAITVGQILAARFGIKIPATK